MEYFFRSPAKSGFCKRNIPNILESNYDERPLRSKKMVSVHFSSNTNLGIRAVVILLNLAL